MLHLHVACAAKNYCASKQTLQLLDKYMLYMFLAVCLWGVHDMWSCDSHTKCRQLLLLLTITFGNATVTRMSFKIWSRSFIYNAFNVELHTVCDSRRLSTTHTPFSQPLPLSSCRRSYSHTLALFGCYCGPWSIQWLIIRSVLRRAHRINKHTIPRIWNTQPFHFCPFSFISNMFLYSLLGTRLEKSVTFEYAPDDENVRFRWVWRFERLWMLSS